MAAHRRLIETIVTPRVYARMAAAWRRDPRLETLADVGGISLKTARKYLLQGSPRRGLPPIAELEASPYIPEPDETEDPAESIGGDMASRPEITTDCKAPAADNAWLTESIKAADTLLTRYLAAIDMVQPQHLPVPKLVEGLEKLLRLRAALCGVAMTEDGDEDAQPAVARRYETA